MKHSTGGRASRCEANNERKTLPFSGIDRSPDVCTGLVVDPLEQHPHDQAARSRPRGLKREIEKI